MTTWEELKESLNLTEEDKMAIAVERELIDIIVNIRETKGLTQEQVAGMCGSKQSLIARLERGVHSPRVDSLLKVLVPLGYTLQIVPIGKGFKRKI